MQPDSLRQYKLQICNFSSMSKPSLTKARPVIQYVFVKQYSMPDATFELWAGPCIAFVFC